MSIHEGPVQITAVCGLRGRRYDDQAVSSHTDVKCNHRAEQPNMQEAAAAG